MSLSKAIKSGKEKRVEYGTKGEPYCKSVSERCRNHGGCPWCEGNRTNKDQAAKKYAKIQILKYKKGEYLW
jgi:hypothetical protein